MSFSNPTNSPFKDKNGQWLTRALFLETNMVDHIEPMYTLKEEDFVDPSTGKLLPSLKKIYMEYNHIPEYEYEFCKEHLGGLIHWRKLCGSQVGTYIAQWREELSVKIKANAMKSIILTAYGDTAVSLQAAKYLSDSGYQMKRGRPSKAEKEAKLKEDVQVNKQIEEDLRRMQLKSVK